MINSITFEGKVLKKDFYQFRNSDKGRLVLFVVNKEYKKENGRWTVKKETKIEVQKITTKSKAEEIRTGDKIIAEGKLENTEFSNKKKTFILAERLTHIPKQKAIIIQNQTSEETLNYEIAEDALF